MSKSALFALLSITNFDIGFTTEVSSWPEEIRVGAMFSVTTDKLYLVALRKAVEDLQETGIVPMHVQFKFSLGGPSCDECTAMNFSWHAYIQDAVDVFIGPECSAALAITALLASNVNIPVFAPFSMMASLANKGKYTTLIRVSQYLNQVEAVAALIAYYNWSNVAIIRNVGVVCDTSLAAINEALDYKDINLAATLVANFSNPDDVGYTLVELKTWARIIVVCGGYTPNTALPMLLKAYEMNMTYPDYLFIIPDFISGSFSPWLPWLDSSIFNTSTAGKYIHIYRSVVVTDSYVISTQVSSQQSSFIDEYVAQHKAAFPKYNPNSNMPLTTFYDAMYLYGVALNKTITIGANYTDGLAIFEATKNASFTGAFGRVTMNSNADRSTRFVAQRILQSGKLETFLLLSRLFADDDIRVSVTNITGTTDWGTPGNVPIDDTPACGFSNELCVVKASGNLLYVILIGFIFFAMLALIIGTLLYRKRQFELVLLETIWKVDMKCFMQLRKSARSSVSRMTITSHDNSLADGASRHTLTRTNQSPDILIGIYFGKRVVAKKYNKSGWISFHKKDLLFIKAMKDTKHDNINNFVGFAGNEVNYFYCFWSVCSRGSLEDVLFNDVIKIDETFQVSLLRDVVSGLSYLHTSPIGYHGKLYAKNCVVDGRWTVKLTNYGMDRVFRTLTNQRAIQIDRKLPENVLICSAPEVIRGELNINNKAVDIYQCAMIAYQILYRKQPFEDASLSKTEIVQLLKTLDYNGNPLRPPLKQVACFDMKFLTLFESCWAENPSARIGAVALKKEIFSHTKKFGQNLMDHILNVLEKYTNNLEKLIEERTEKTNEERKRADNILYQVLPKMVANALKSGHQLPPEVFDSATVCFSSVIGFKEITTNKKPTVIVDTLNMIYRLMDDTIANYDAYKVETILDSYLIVSGVPTRNGNSHATYMADLSINLLQLSRKFHVPAIRANHLTLRIGLNSGSVAAGVIGVTLPRYCLFGDTVNIASRMESTGEADKIHISESVYSILEPAGGYQMKKRGTVMVKGKGNCVTYWLLDKKWGSSDHL